MVLNTSIKKDNIFTDEKSSLIYEDENGSIFNSKLISVSEKIFQTSFIDADTPTGFKKQKFETLYTLIFDEGYGHKRELVFNSRPENVGEYYYYVLKDNKLICLFKEKDEIDKYITQDIPEITNVFTRFNNFWFNKVFLLFSLATSLASFSYLLYMYLTDHLKNGSITLLIGSIFSLFVSLLLDLLILEISEKIGKAINRKEKRGFFERLKNKIN